MKIWSRVRYSTMDYGAIFPRELMYTTEGGKSFLARNKQSFFEDFGLLLSFVLKEKLQQGWLINSNNDSYINNHHHCIYDHGHNIGTLILILIINLINHPPWRPFNQKKKLVNYPKRQKADQSAAKEYELNQGKLAIKG